ncbi:MAG: alpha/beta fold hydrolase [Povalibacter sp.]
MLKGIFRGLSWIVLVLLVSITAVLTTCRYQADRRENIPAALAAPKTGHFVDAGDANIFVQERGSKDGPAVLFVHGTGAWSGLWKQTLDATASAGFHVIAIDLPPFGFSEKTPNLSYSKFDQGKRIVKVLESLGVSHATLVGHSFGAGPTVEAALLHPERVTKLIIVDGALSLQAPDANLEHRSIASRMTHAVLHMEPLRNAVVATFVTNPRFTRKLFQSLIADPEKATDWVVDVLQQPMHVEEPRPRLGGGCRSSSIRTRSPQARGQRNTRN